MKKTETNILSEVLKKKGIKDVTELSEEEKAQFEQWRKTLLTENITVESIQQFCEYNLNIIEAQFKDLDNSKDKAEKLILLHSVYSSLCGLISSPQKAKESLINHLTGLLV